MKAPPENQRMQEVAAGPNAIDMQDWPNDWLTPQGQLRAKRVPRRDNERLAMLRQQSQAERHARDQRRAERIARDRELARASRNPKES